MGNAIYPKFWRFLGASKMEYSKHLPYLATMAASYSEPLVPRPAAKSSTESAPTSTRCCGATNDATGRGNPIRYRSISRIERVLVAARCGTKAVQFCFKNPRHPDPSGTNQCVF